MAGKSYVYFSLAIITMINPSITSYHRLSTSWTELHHVLLSTIVISGARFPIFNRWHYFTAAMARVLAQFVLLALVTLLPSVLSKIELDLQRFEQTNGMDLIDASNVRVRKYNRTTAVLDGNFTVTRDLNNLYMVRSAFDHFRPEKSVTFLLNREVWSWPTVDLVTTSSTSTRWNCPSRSSVNCWTIPTEIISSSLQIIATFLWFRKRECVHFRWESTGSTMLTLHLRSYRNFYRKATGGWPSPSPDRMPILVQMYIHDWRPRYQLRGDEAEKSWSVEIVWEVSIFIITVVAINYKHGS